MQTETACGCMARPFGRRSLAQGLHCRPSLLPRVRLEGVGIRQQQQLVVAPAPCQAEPGAGSDADAGEEESYEPETIENYSMDQLASMFMAARAELQQQRMQKQFNMQQQMMQAMAGMHVGFGPDGHAGMRGRRPEPPDRTPRTKGPYLPPQQGQPRKTLVLDLDATLISYDLRQSAKVPPDFTYSHESGAPVYVWRRPHVLEFLRAVKEDFELVMFTASRQAHADGILAHLDPNGDLFEHRLYDRHTSGMAMVKDLEHLGRDLAQTLLVDDRETAAWPLENWVSIQPFYQFDPDWQTDTALLYILDFLRDKVLPAKDVREAVEFHYDQAARKPIQVLSSAS